jgi:hypothetical protein
MQSRLTLGVKPPRGLVWQFGDIPDEIVVLSIRYLRSALSCRKDSKCCRQHGAKNGSEG